jgi:trigger factor
MTKEEDKNPASASKSLKKQTTPKKGAPKKSVSTKASTTETTPKKSVSTKASTTETTPKKSVSTKASTTETAPKKSAPIVADKEPVLESHDFSNDSIDLKVEVKKNCKIEFTTTVKAGAKSEAEKRALKSIKKEVSIPGFRKGKAPESLIRNQYADTLKERQEKELVDVAFFESIKLSKYTPFDPKKSKFNGYSDGKSALKFEIECYPKLVEIDYSSLKLANAPKKEVSQKDYDDAIYKLQNMHSEQKEIEDRGVKEGDYVLVDVEDLDSETTEKVFSNTRFEVAKGKISEWMQEAILGKMIKEQIETTSKADSDVSEEEKKEFKDKRVRITINQIQETSLPALNDELAKKYQLATMKELEASVRHCLEQKYDKENKKIMRDAIGEQLKNIKTEIPASILEQESNHRITQMFSDPKFKSEWAKMNDEEKEAKKNDVVKEAKESLVLMFITQKIIAENKLKIGEFKESEQPSVIQMAVDFDPMMFFKPSTDEQKNMDYSMRTIQTAEDFVIEKLQSNT